MPRFFLYILTWIAFAAIALAQPKHEVRAAWLTTAYGLDWPSQQATTARGAERQKQELRNMLDYLEALRFNTVLFQVRIRGDVAYPSTIEPFNEIFSGKEGSAPPYDPLAFAIEECHKRGMELHAWMVTIPLGTESHVRKQGKEATNRRYPALCKKHGSEWYLNPGHPDTKSYLMKLVNEIISKYEVDGIHLDYIRYPDRPANFPDNDTYRKYGNGKPIGTWRRENITAIVRHLYEEVKKRKPWIKMSSSPIGKFNDTSRYPSMGWNAYRAVYQDAQGWLREGIQDILFPMMYFKGNGFFPFAADWQEKCYGRQIVPGLGIYFLHPSEKNWPLEEIERQIYFTRSQGLAGQGYFRSRFITGNTKQLSDELACNFYAYPALPPAMTWLDNTPPSVPENFCKEETAHGTSLSWSCSKDNDPRIPPLYNIYVSNYYPVDVNLPENLIAARLTKNNYIYSTNYPYERKRYFAVTATDRYGNESPPAYLEENIRFQSSLSKNGYVLSLPPAQIERFIVITDISGRCVQCMPYSSSVSIEKLSKGVYFCLVTDADGNMLYKKEFIR